jgi:hypothetical protein
MTGSALTGCLPVDDRCGDESRSVTAMTKFPSPASMNGCAQVQLVEHRTQEPRQTLWWIIQSPSFGGEITTARLVLTADPTQMLLELPVIPGPDDVLLHGELQPYVGPIRFRDLYQHVLASRLALSLQTTAPGHTQLLLPLRLFDSSGWARPHCS